MHKKNYSRISIIIFVVYLLLGFSSTTYAVEYGGIGGRPANPDPANPRTESIFVHTISPSNTVGDAIRLINNTSETKTLTVYGVDSIVSSGGAFACAQKADVQNGSGSWIKLSKSVVTLVSLTNEVIPFSITLPANASVGEHNACIVIQEQKAEGSDEGKTGVVLSFRTGIRVAILVPGEIVRKLEIGEVTSTKKENGDISFKPKVKNTGNVSIDATVNIIIKNTLGIKVATLGGQYPVLRGEESEWNLDFKKPFWGGWYNAFYTVEYDAGVNAGVGTKSGEALTMLSANPIRIFSMPETTALVIEFLALVLILVLIFLAVVAHKRSNWIKNTWVSYSVAEGEDLMAIAKKHNVSWKLLAKVNKLKAPYALSTGGTISVPPLVDQNGQK